MLDRIKYFRRRQFILGPGVNDYNGWKRLNLFHNYILSHHPDLPASIIYYKKNTVALLGYLIDPYRPKLDNEGVLQRFITGEITASVVAHHLETLTGRFVLIINCPKGTWLFHDPCGLRQVNYYKDEDGCVWCASQPEAIAEHFRFEYDKDMLHFRQLPEYRRTTEDFALINDRSPFKEIQYLLANHYLDLQSGDIYRYWPYENCIGALSINRSIEAIKPLLQNSIEAAASRFDLHMGITAGCDSRKTLAACKTIKDKIYFFTYTPMPGKEADSEVPARLLPKLGVEHHKLNVLQMDPEFEKFYRASATWARDRHGHLSYTAIQYFGPDTVVLNSNISEYSQVSYWLPKSQINGKGLALLKSLNHPLAIYDYQRWLDGSYALCQLAHINVLILFQLELRSRWVANTFAECDIAYESFNPYNNRRLFQLELSVNERLRRGQRWDYPIKLIKSMWPEVMQSPINPERYTVGKVKRFVLRNILHKAITPYVPLVEYFRYRKLRRAFLSQT